MKFIILASFCFLTSCSSIRWFTKHQRESPRSPLSKMGSLKMELVNSQQLTPLARIHSWSRYQKNSSTEEWSSLWQWRDRNALGAPPQSMVAPIILGQNEALFMTMGGGIERRNYLSKSLVWKIEVPQGVASKPYVQGDKLYFAGMDSYLRAIDLKIGKEFWKILINAESLGGITSINGNLYVTTADNSLWSIKEDNGQILWTYKRPAPAGPVIWSLRGQAVPALSLDGRSLYLGFSDGVFVSLDALSGKTNWERRFERAGLFRDADTSAVIVRGGRVVVLSLVDGDLVALNTQDGSVLWSQKIGSFAAPLYDVTSNKLWVPGGDGRVYRLNPDNGVVEWDRELGFKGLASQPVFLLDKYIAFTSSHFGLVVMDKDNGQMEFSYSMGSGSTTPVAVDGEHLLTLNSRNLLLVFKAKKRLWKQEQASR